jgi:hypothetical protein
VLEQGEGTPPIGAPGIVIAGEGPIEVRAGEPIWIDAAVLVPADADSDPRLWCRSLFVSCIAEESQFPLVVSLLKDRVVAPSEIERCELEAGSALRLPLHFELGRELGVELEPARYHVQISARQYRSRIVPLVVA